MSDFNDVDFFENVEQMESKGPEVAPTGDYEAKIIAAEKYKSKSGNWTQKYTFQIDGGKYRDHTEWYNLWSTNETTKKISSEMHSRLALAVGFKKLPEFGKDFIGKTIKVNMKQFEDVWTDGEGQQRTSLKSKIMKLEKSTVMSPPQEAKPPF